MLGNCFRCGAKISQGHNFCTQCGAPLAAHQSYTGKTAPMVIATQKMPPSGWITSPNAAAGTPALPGGTQGYVTTGVAGSEAEVVTGDRSGSTGEKGLRGTKMDDIKVATRAHVLQKMHIDRQDCLSVVSFASDATIDCDWTVLRDPSPLLAAIDSLSPSGGTCFKSGLEKAEALFGRCPSIPGKQVLRKVIFFTDGYNNEGDPVHVAERLKSAGVIIQAVGFGADENDVDVDTLRSIVSVIDNKEQYWFCRDAQALTRTFKALSSKTKIFPRGT